MGTVKKLLNELFEEDTLLGLYQVRRIGERQLHPLYTSSGYFLRLFDATYYHSYFL